MRLSAFSVVDARPSAASFGEGRAREVVRLAEIAEESGLVRLWVAEHHFQSGGVCPSPPVLLAACGSRTGTLRLGSLVSVLPFHRTIDLAEEYALLDQLLEGRLDLGLGSGYVPAELSGFGIDPATKRDRFDRILANLLEAFAGGAIEAEPGAPVRVRPNVRPVQQPHPPIWIAVQRREAIPHVARRGVSLALIPYAPVSGVDELREEIEVYRRHLPAGARGEVLVALHLYAGDRPELARACLGRYLETRLETGSPHYAEQVRRAPEGATPSGLEERGFALFGPASSVVERLERLEAIGVDEVAGIFDFGGLPPDEVERSVRSLGAAWRARIPARTPGAALRSKPSARV